MSSEDGANKAESMVNKAVAEAAKGDITKFKLMIGQITNLDENRLENVEISDPIAFYNHALILFHERKYRKAWKIVKQILKDIKHLDDKLLQNAGLLGVNLLLETNQFRAADELLDELNAKLGGICKEIIEDELYAEEKVEHEKVDNPMEDFRRVFRLTMIRSNMLNGKVVSIPNEDTAEYCILRGHKYYLGHDYQMAAKELAKNYKNDPVTVRKQGEDQSVCIANNMGLIHFAVRHFALAVRFFQQALIFDQKSIESLPKNNLPIFCIGSSRRTEILYNMGLALLHLQRPRHAFECFLVPLQTHQNNPRLWLRVAEACIAVHKDAMKDKEPKNIVCKGVGAGIHRKYILTPATAKYVSTEHQSFAIPSPTVEFAALCLRNAVTLMDHYTIKCKNILRGNEKPKGWLNADEGINSDPSRPLTREAFERLRIAILSAYAYVLLAIGDYVLALKYGKELVAIENLPESYKVLGHLYCAEALIMLNRITEAFEYITPNFIKSLQGDDFETRNWSVNSLDAAQAILTYNLATTLAIQGEIQLSKKIMMACKHPIVFTRLKILKMYHEIRGGNLDNCERLVRLDTPQFI